MSKQLQKLELTWIGKDNEPKLEPRILIEDISKSHGVHLPIVGKSGKRIAESNMLIQGDNLLALKALESDFAGEVKCVCIDPPYNTGSAFEQYDDGVEHSLWLNLMRDRLKLFHSLLSEDGSIWICIDDNEAHYLKVLLDELFGRQNFVASVIWEKSDSPRMDAVFFSARHDYILCYAKNKEKLKLYREQINDLPDHYDKFDEMVGKPYYLKPLRAMGGEDRREDRPSMYFPLIAPDGKEVYPKRQDGSDGRWRWGLEKIDSEKARIEFVKGRSGWSVYYRIYSETTSLKPIETIWKHEEVGSNRTSKAEIKEIFGSKAFDTPKPEKLIYRIIHLATKENEIVIDSFLGSGTTAAVAHKMNRRWVGIELGEHASTHCYPRLKRIADGNDKVGITSEVGWKGGSGFKFYTLAPSLLKQDEYGNWIIDTQYNADMLAAAMAKQEGFHYSPDEILYWKQGRSSEKDFIFTTTQFVTVEMLDKLHQEMKPDEGLLICCKSFKKECQNRYQNVTIKKIPQMLLGRCEFGKDDYSLNIVNMPQKEQDNDHELPVQAIETVELVQMKKNKKAKADDNPTLF